MEKDELSEITQAVYSGSLADKIKKNASYTITGMFIGGFIGGAIAGFLGKGKMMGALMGAAAVGLGGYVMSNNTKKIE